MNKGRVSLRILAYACSVIFAGAAVGEAFAAAKSAKEPAPAILTTKSPKPQSEQGQKPAGLRAKKRGTSTGLLHRQIEGVQKQAQQAPIVTKSPDAKSHRSLKVHKKVAPKAVVQARTDLMYHGMFEDPQRYDPRPNYRTAGVPNPQTPDLTHDHFQELDRNQDGKIDPVERAFGRLHMDRDLSDRRFR